MIRNSSTGQKMVHNFTKMALMKFVPVVETSQKEPETLINRIKSYVSKSMQKKLNQALSPRKKQSIAEPSQINISKLQKQRSQKVIKLKHLHLLTNQHLLIGDQNQVDVINLNCVIGNYLDSEFVWSLNIKKPINLIAVDIKKSILAIFTTNQFLIYNYQLKRGTNLPVLITKLNLQLMEKILSVQFSKNGHLVLFYESFLQIYTLDGILIKKIFSKKYCGSSLMSLNKISLFKIPNIFQNTIKVFLQQYITNSAKIGLWFVQIQILPSEIKMSNPLKAYQIQQDLSNKILIESYSKQIFFINLGSEIIAIKKGYFIDSINVNIQRQDYLLKYVGSNKLLHLLDDKIDIYKIQLKNSNPPKLQITSIDSIQIQSAGTNYQFFGCFQIFSDNIVLIFQLNEDSNIMINQTRYKLTVSKKVSLEQKINSILPSKEQLISNKFQQIQEKCDMVKKMGLSNRQVYLRLWNISNKQSIKDYQYLLSTDSYETIKEQIQKKLRKNSMSYRQIHTIETICCQVLLQKVFSQKFTLEHLKNYLMSHFLIKKFELYLVFTKIQEQFKVKKNYNLKDMKKDQKDKETQNKQVMINIQNYHKFSKADIKLLFFQLISEYCIQNKQEYILKIRTLIKFFKFAFRIDYSSYLIQIIKIAGNNLLNLISSIPQIFPYQPLFQQQNTPQDPQLFYGIWRNINIQDWQKSLYKQKILTINNRQQIEQGFVSDVWFRRNWLTLHDCVFLSSQQILAIQQKNKSNETFYLIINEIFQTIKVQQKIKEIIDYLQLFYSKMPSHLYKKVFVYKKLFDNLCHKKFQGINTFKQFLMLQDYQLFKTIFDYQKMCKNSIFTQIKPLFLQICEQEDTFNQGLLNYFNSSLSQISDIKYLLNRMNNKNKEFHKENEQTYEVLVQGIQSKLKIGSQNDIPIQQVLIYIENIPLPQQNQIMQELHILQIINDQSQRFRRMKLNMSVYQIINDPDRVIASIIQYQIQVNHVFQLIQSQEVLNITYKIIAQTQAIKQKIYAEEEDDLTLFIYLNKILQQQKMIRFVPILLQDKFLNQYYTIDEQMIENLVLYMYKWKFSIDSVYINNFNYIKQLILLLPDTNQTRIYLDSQISLAILLSHPNEPLQYRWTGQTGIPSILQIQNLINNVSNEMLCELDPNYIYEKVKSMQQIASLGEVSNIRLKDIYEVIIIRLIQKQKLKQVIPKIKFMIQKYPDSPYNYIYLVMIINRVYRQFCEQNKNGLSLCCRYLYYDCKKFLQILQNLICNKYNSQQQKEIIFKELNKIQNEKKLNLYSTNNQMFQKQYINILKGSVSELNVLEMRNNFNFILKEVQKRLIKSKDQFKPIQYQLIFCMLSNNPYVLVKYVYINRFTINVKIFRCFLSYLIREDIFNELNVLQFGKRLFKMLYQSLHQQKPIEDVIQEFKKIPFSQILQVQKIRVLDNQMDRKISKSLDRFKNKIKTVLNQLQLQKSKGLTQSFNQKLLKIVQKIKNPFGQIFQPLNYIFHDSDDDAQNKQKQIKRQELNKKNEKSQFDAKFQRTVLMSRRDKPAGLYISLQKSPGKNLFFSQNYGISGQTLAFMNKSKRFPSLKKHLNSKISMQKQQIQRSGQLSIQQGISQNNDSTPKKKTPFKINRVQSQYVNINEFNLVSALMNSNGVGKQQDSKSINQFEIQTLLKKEKQLKMNNIQPQKSQKNTQMKHLSKWNNKFEKTRKISQEVYEPFDTSKSQSQVKIQLIEEQTSPSPFLNGDFLNKIIYKKILDIIKDQKQQDYKIIITLAEDQSNKQTFPSFMKLIIEKIYQQNRPVSQVLTFIKQVSDKYPKFIINKSFVEIYLKMSTLHQKFDLKIPLKKVFPVDGLFIRSNDPEQLYKFIKPKVIELISVKNLVKISKVLSLAFKKSQFQQETIFAYLKNFVQQIVEFDKPFQQKNKIINKKAIDNSKQNQKKLKELLKQIPLLILNRRAKEIIDLLPSTGESQSIYESDDSNFKLKILTKSIMIQMIVNVMTQKNDIKLAQTFKHEWQINFW